MRGHAALPTHQLPGFKILKRFTQGSSGMTCAPTAQGKSLADSAAAAVAAGVGGGRKATPSRSAARSARCRIIFCGGQNGQLSSAPPQRVLFASTESLRENRVVAYKKTNRGAKSLLTLTAVQPPVVPQRPPPLRRLLGVQSSGAGACIQTRSSYTVTHIGVVCVSRTTALLARCRRWTVERGPGREDDLAAGQQCTGCRRAGHRPSLCSLGPCMSCRLDAVCQSPQPTNCTVASMSAGQPGAGASISVCGQKHPRPSRRSPAEDPHIPNSPPCSSNCSAFPLRLPYSPSGRHRLQVPPPEAPSHRPLSPWPAPLSASLR